MTAVRLGFLFTLLGCVVCACRLESAVAPRTQVVVDIDADLRVRPQIEQLRLIVSGSDERSELPRAEPSSMRDFGVGQEAELHWPVRVTLVPQGDRAERAFMLTATAFADAQRQLAQVRVLSSYVAGEVRHVQLLLSARCLEVRCGDTETCAAGSCKDAWLEPRELARFWPSIDAGAGADAAADLPDAGFDAGGPPALVDAGPFDPCQTEHGGCDPLVTCQPLDGLPVCGACPPGYVDVNADGTQCRDIDECEKANGGCDEAHAQCTNTPGGRDCSCKDGYHGDGKRCTLNFPCTLPSDCAATARCQGIEDQLRCVCMPGYAGDGLTCTDVDECERKTDMCRANASCSNSDGSFACPCKPGFSELLDACVDSDECAANTDDCDDVPNACANEEGSFRCKCPPGYRGDGKGVSGCEDIDECAADSDNCDDVTNACVNDTGRFHCACPAGYTGNGVGDDSCQDIDECGMDTDGCDDLPEACVNTIGGFHCACPAGYGGDGRSSAGCVDLDECAANSDGCDDTPNACVNEVGTFHCACPPGYLGDGVGTLGCNDIDECAANSDGCDDVPNACVNDPGTSHCACPPGYTGGGVGSLGCDDIDECVANSDNCVNLLGACVNDPGTFHCQCPAGYMGTGLATDGCADIDECLAGTHTCSRTPPVACMNNTGSFTCGTCPTGYTGDGHTCTDVDECMAGTHTCSLNPIVPCTNTVGSYLCGTCPAGYMGDGLTCVDRDECMDGSHTCSRSPVVSCSNTVGSYTCGACPTGYMGDGHTCEDVNECLANNGGCDQAPLAQCLNGPGSVTCTCPPGTVTHNAAVGAGGCEPNCVQCYEGWDGQSATCSSSQSIVPLGADTAQASMQTLASDTLFGFQITIPAKSHVAGLGAFSRAAADGPQLRLGLYTDNAGAPGNLVAQTAWFANLGANMVNELPPQGAVSCFALTGTYWVVGVASGNVVVLGQAAAGSVPFVSLAGSSDLPAIWPGGGAEPNGAPLSLYVRYDHP